MTAARTPRGIGRLFGRRKDQPGSAVAPTPPSPSAATHVTVAPGTKKAATPKAATPKAAPAAKAATPKAAPAAKNQTKAVPAAKPAAPKAAKPAVKKAAAVKAPEQRAPAVRAAAGTAAAKKAAPIKAAPIKAAPTRAAQPAVPARVTARKAPDRPALPGSGPLTGADAWTKAELTAMGTVLEGQAQELRSEIVDAEVMVESLKRAASAESSGDEADAGTKTFEREHEMSLANNSRDLLLQTERALARLSEGSYGRCEDCGNPIPKARLQAAPRATLCVTCKQREERR